MFSSSQSKTVQTLPSTYQTFSTTKNCIVYELVSSTALHRYSMDLSLLTSYAKAGVNRLSVSGLTNPLRERNTDHWAAKFQHFYLAKENWLFRNPIPAGTRTNNFRKLAIPIGSSLNLPPRGPRGQGAFPTCSCAMRGCGGF